MINITDGGERNVYSGERHTIYGKHTEEAKQLIGEHSSNRNKGKDNDITIGEFNTFLSNKTPRRKLDIMKIEKI